MSKKPTVLMILDGYGMSDKVEGNAIAQAKTPVMDKLMAECPFVLGQASGMAVGLPEGQMGNSEVGHTNMGAGRIVYQMLVKISKSIQDGDFFENEALKKAIENCKKNDSALHLMGLLSPAVYTATWSICMACLNWQRKMELTKCMFMLILMDVTCHHHRQQNIWKKP